MSMKLSGFEALVRQALLESASAEWEAAPSGEDAAFSLRYLAWEKQVLASPFSYVKRRSRPLWRRAMWAAACLGLAAAISLGCLMAANPTARAWVQRVFAQWFDDHARFTFPGTSGQESGVWRTGYLPEGFELVEETVAGRLINIIYKDKAGAALHFTYAPATGTSFGVDTEHHLRQSVTIRGNEGYLLLSYVPGHPSFLIWTDAERSIAFKLTAEISQDELIKIAENIIIQE